MSKIKKGLISIQERELGEREDANDVCVWSFREHADVKS